MSRVFTIHFPFKGKNYTALVSLRSQPDDLLYSIKYLDEELEALVPGNRLLVSLPEGVQHPNGLSELARDLVHKTTEAVNGYLQLHEVAI